MGAGTGVGGSVGVVNIAAPTSPCAPRAVKNLIESERLAGDQTGQRNLVGVQLTIAILNGSKRLAVAESGRAKHGARRVAQGELLVDDGTGNNLVNHVDARQCDHATRRNNALPATVKPDCATYGRRKAIVPRSLERGRAVRIVRQQRCKLGKTEARE